MTRDIKGDILKWDGGSWVKQLNNNGGKWYQTAGGATRPSGTGVSENDYLLITSTGGGDTEGDVLQCTNGYTQTWTLIGNIKGTAGTNALITDAAIVGYVKDTNDIVRLLAILKSTLSLSWTTRDIKSIYSLEDLTLLTTLDLSHNKIDVLNLPKELTALTTLRLLDNELTALDLPVELINLENLNLSENLFTSFTVKTAFTKLKWLYIEDCSLASLVVPSECIDLTLISAGTNSITSMTIQPELIKLDQIKLNDNLLTSFTFPTTLTVLTSLLLQNNALPILTIDTILANCNTSGISGATIALEGGTNGTPTGENANTDIIALRARGCTVTFNTST